MAFEVSDFFMNIPNMLVQAAFARIPHVLGQAAAAPKRLCDGMHCVHVLLPFILHLEGGVAPCLRAREQIMFSLRPLVAMELARVRFELRLRDK